MGREKTGFLSRLLGAEYITRRGETVVNIPEFYLKLFIVLLSFIGIMYSSVSLYANHAGSMQEEKIIKADKADIEFISKKETGENGEISISSENFPDEVFRDYILKTADLNFDESLSRDETDNVKNIILSNREDLKNLAGIDFFKNLEYLSIVNTGVTKLDAGSLPNIKTLRISGTGITSLDLSGNSRLVTLEINNMTFRTFSMPEESAITTVKNHNSNIKCETENHIYNVCKLTD